MPTPNTWAQDRIAGVGSLHVCRIHSGQMLQVRMMLTGDMVACISVHELKELNDVRGLKRHLNQWYGMPSRFRQRLLLQDETLKDTVELRVSMDLHLVLLPYADNAQDQANKLVFAALSGSIVEVEWMLYKRRDPNLLDSRGRAALLMASSAGYVEIVRLLLEAGANKEAADDDGRTALLTASCAGHVNIVRILLAAGADKEVVDHGCRTALWTASDAGHVEIVRSLLKAEAKKDVADKDGRSALCTAAFKGHVEVVRLMLEADAYKEVPDNDGHTALWLADSVGHTQAFRTRLEAGVSKDVTDCNGRTTFGGHVLQVTSRLFACCWRLVPTRMWQTCRVSRP